jgi:hypothetical protein
MEIAEVRKRVQQAIARARRHSAERRARVDEATHAFTLCLEQIVTPLVRQIANVLRADGHPFSVFTPAGSVRLMSDRRAEDYIEIALDASGDAPLVTGHSSRMRGGNVLQVERVIGSGDPATLTEEDVLTFVLSELEPLVER